MTARETSVQGRSPLFPQRINVGVSAAISSIAQGISGSQVENVLRNLPSHGWTAGWIGRRDRALLVLSQMAGLPFETIAELTVADVTVRDGMAIIRSTGGTTTLRKNDDDLICAPCALARWLHALDMTVVYSSCRVSTAVLARAAPLTSHSPHLCQGNVSVSDTTSRMTLLPSIDQYGPLVDSLPPVAAQSHPARNPTSGHPAQPMVAPRPSVPPPAKARRLDISGPDQGHLDERRDGRTRGLEGRARFLLRHQSGFAELH